MNYIKKRERKLFTKISKIITTTTLLTIQKHPIVTLFLGE
jgi:hypothetical protein